MDMAQPETETETGSPVTPFPESDSPALSTAPSFVKTIRTCTMQCHQFVRKQNTRRVAWTAWEEELPSTFVKENGDRFRKLVTLRGPSGQTKSVHLRVQSHGQDRVHFQGAGWRDFVLECGFKVGYRLHFSLVSTSTFSVRLLEKAASFAPANKYKLSPTRPRTIPISRFDDVAEPRSSTRTSKNVKKNDVVYKNGTWKHKPEVDALLENLQCPHFVAVIWKSHLRDFKSSALCVPAKFLEKYGMYFADVHVLQGPSGGTVQVRFAVGTKGARFTTGWKAFHRENGIQLGDVLLFSLLAPASWLVQVVAHGPRSEELGTGVQPE